MTRAHYLFGWGFVAICGALLLGARRPRERVTYERASQRDDASTARNTRATSNAAASSASEEQWFRRVRPYCNAVEVRVLQGQSPPPATTKGAGYHAACFALAGQI